jgi:hypothetical protein
MHSDSKAILLSIDIGFELAIANREICGGSEPSSHISFQIHSRLEIPSIRDLVAH